MEKDLAKQGVYFFHIPTTNKEKTQNTDLRELAVTDS